MDTGGGSRAGSRDDEAGAPLDGVVVATDVPGPVAPTEQARGGTSGRPRDRHRIVGVLLLGGWLAWFVVTALFQPRVVTDAQFRQDVRSGDVVAWRLVDLTRDREGSSWSERIALRMPSVEADGTVIDDGGTGIRTIAWTTSAPFTRVLDSTTDPLPDEYAAALRAAGVPQTTTYFASPRLDRPDWGLWPGPALALLYLGVLLNAPRPVHGTRWFWFWSVFPTLGVGVVLYAVAEHLRRPRGLPDAVAGHPFDVVDTPRRLAPAGLGTNRRSGLSGFLLSIVLGFVTLAALTVLVDATGWVWLVRP